ncbi:membrane protein insertase YidC 2 [Spirochaetota bacterium]|nr:membrane protein insertase YidC 2 [Spirochaetota bacterium]
MALLPENRYEKIRYPIAVVLSTAVVLGWYLFFAPPPNQEEVPDPTPPADVTKSTDPTEQSPLPTEEQSKPTNPDFVLDTESLSSSSPADSTDASSLAEQSVDNAKPQLVELSTEAIKITLSTVDAAIVKAFIVNTTERSSSTSQSEDLEQMNLKGFPTGKLFFTPDLPGLNQEIPSLVYKLVSATETKVVFKTELAGQSGIVSIFKTYTIKDRFSIELAVSFLDENGNEIRVPYYISNGSNLGTDQKTTTPFDIKQLSYEVGSDNESILGASFLGSDKTIDEYNGSVDWVAIDNRFYARILVPNNKEFSDKSIFMKRSYLTDEANENFYLASALKISGTGTDAFTYYFLPKNRAVLNMYYETENQYFFNLFHQFSFMRILSSIMYWLLEEINVLFNNYGWSILVMTLLIKVATLPLSHKGMKSMYKMQALSPKIEAIKAQYKNNPQKMNAEMMLFYKKEKISPLGGCLPMLVPIPIFIALYSLFQNMVELRGVPFFWINDLSLPDTVYTLSFSIPFLGNGVNLLPIIMTATALIQSLLPMSPQQTKAKLSTSTSPMAESMQKQMTMMKYIFPIMFFFICWNLPSALVFFWTVQNVFSLAQTFYTKKVINLSRG